MNCFSLLMYNLGGIMLVCLVWWQHSSDGPAKLEAGCMADTTTIPRRRRTKTPALSDVDDRLRPVKRSEWLREALIQALGGTVEPHQEVLIRHAAELIAIAGKTHASYLGVRHDQ